MLFVFLVCFVLIFWRAAEAEDLDHSWAWGLASAVIFIATTVFNPLLLYLGSFGIWGVLAWWGMMFAGQFMLFIAMMVVISLGEHGGPSFMDTFGGLFSAPKECPHCQADLRKRVVNKFCPECGEPLKRERMDD